MYLLSIERERNDAMFRHHSALFGMVNRDYTGSPMMDKYFFNEAVSALAISI